MVMVNIRKKIRYRGIAVVEMALVLPILLLLTLGAIRYGWLFLKAQQITNATRYGARVAIRPDATIEFDVLPVIESLMSAAGMPQVSSDYAVMFTPEDISPVEGVGGKVTVKMTVPVTNIDLMPIPLFTDIEPEGWEIGASVTMAKEGP
jgi:hypothetical protein